MLHETLWQANLDLARACLEHPFVRALGDGTLDLNAFRRYVAQDAFFLGAFARAYALALARSPDRDTMACFHVLIGGALEELQLHRDYATELGVDLAAVTPNPACRAYTDFLLRTAWHASLAETVAAMTPCMRLYAYLGCELAAKNHERHPYRRWIDVYGGREFQDLAAGMDALLDRVASDTREVRESYRYAMECELGFFTGALEQAR